MKGWNTAEEFYEKYNTEKTPELMADRSYVNSGMGAWGFLLREGLVDVDFVCRFNTPSWIISWWEMNEPLFMESRKRNPDQAKDFEFLYNAVRKKYPNIEDYKQGLQKKVIERLKAEK
jgi:hypothetical protein